VNQWTPAEIRAFVAIARKHKLTRATAKAHADRAWRSGGKVKKEHTAIVEAMTAIRTSPPMHSYADAATAMARALTAEAYSKKGGIGAAERRNRQESRRFLERQGRPVLMKGADSFNDVFESVDQGKKIVAVSTAKMGRTTERMGFSNFVSMSRVPGRHSMYATPKREVLQALEGSMIVVAHDEVYFEIVDRGGGNALVVAKHNAIIGSRYVAIIDPSTIPGG
jgi:hypothetical protein